MVVRKKNLLDAFRQAAPEGSRAPVEQKRSSNPAGPFAHAPRSADAPAELEQPAEPAASADFDFAAAPAPDRRSALARLVSDPGFRLVLLVAALIGVGAWTFSKFGSKSAQAADHAPLVTEAAAGGGVLASGAAGSDAVEKNQAAARMGTSNDQAFMNPENRFTVRLVQYNNDAEGMRKAVETADFLRKLAIPVVSPIAKGKTIVLAAGAKPRSSDLGALLKVVQAQRGPGGQEKLPFASAYIENIDALVQRR